MQCNAMQCDAMRCSAMQGDARRCNEMQSKGNEVQCKCNTMKCNVNTVQWNAMQSKCNANANAIQMQCQFKCNPNEMQMQMQCIQYFLSSLIFQVSKFEKFGYGVMVTQVAATCPGIVSLGNSGSVIFFLKFRNTHILLRPAKLNIFLCSGNAANL